MTSCTHGKTIRTVTPSARGCEECLKIGSEWVHLRLCRTCGHVGCCDSSPHRHATAHFHATQHPIIEGYDPPEGWGWCYVDNEERLAQSDAATRADSALCVKRDLVVATCRDAHCFHVFGCVLEIAAHTNAPMM